jgi:hypothetical protein
MSRVVILVLLVLAPGVARAQIVNVQGALAKQPEEDGLIGQLEARLDWRAGNNPLFDVGGAANVLMRRGNLLGLAIVRAEYGRGRDSTFKRKTFEHVRVRATLDCRWRWEAFAQHELDGFRRLVVRALAGTGPALQIVDVPAISVLAGTAYLLEYERLDDREGVADAGARGTAHRGSFYVTATQKLGATTALNQTVYVQPRLDEPGDVRMLAELAVTSKITERVSLTQAFVGAYDRRPPAGIERHDTQLRVSVLVTL